MAILATGSPSPLLRSPPGDRWGACRRRHGTLGTRGRSPVQLGYTSSGDLGISRRRQPLRSEPCRTLSSSGSDLRGPPAPPRTGHSVMLPTTQDPDDFKVNLLGFCYRTSAQGRRRSAALSARDSVTQLTLPGTQRSQQVSTQLTQDLPMLPGTSELGLPSVYADAHPKAIAVRHFTGRG